jgi:hypothetical protein
MVFLHHYHEWCTHNGISLPLPLNEVHEAVGSDHDDDQGSAERSLYYDNDEDQSLTEDQSPPSSGSDYAPGEEENELDKVPSPPAKRTRAARNVLGAVNTGKVSDIVPHGALVWHALC